MTVRRTERTKSVLVPFCLKQKLNRREDSLRTSPISVCALGRIRSLVLWFLGFLAGDVDALDR